VSNAAVVLKEKQRRLALVDMLLWDLKSEPDTTNSSSPNGWQSAWLASIVHAVLSILMRGLYLHFGDTSVLLYHDTIPGPWQSKGAVRKGVLASPFHFMSFLSPQLVEDSFG
jgi:hypothetical protein